MKGIPLYKTIYNHFYDEIANGELEKGAQLPTESAISAQFLVSRITAKKAMNMLAEEGLIYRIPGKGSFVKNKSELKICSKAMKQNRGNLIGVILCDIGVSFGMEVLRGIESAAADMGYNVIFKRSLESVEEEIKIINELKDIGVSGIIIQAVHGEMYNSEILKHYLNGMPFVFVDRNMGKTDIPFIITDNVSVTKRTIIELIDAGYKDIHFLSANPNGTSALEQRYEGFKNGFYERNLSCKENQLLDLESPLYTNVDGTIREKDKERIRKYIINNSELDCVFAVELKIALLVKEVLESMGRRIPEDISILCFDECDHTDMRKFTYLKQQQYQMGTRAIQILDDIIKGHVSESLQVYLDASLVIGETTNLL